MNTIPLATRRWLGWSVLGAAFFLSFFHRIAPAVIADHLMRDFSVGAAGAGALASMYFYIYMVLQVPTGILADTVGPRRTVAVGSLVAAAGSLVFALAPTFAFAMFGRFLVGLGVSVAFICALRAQAFWFLPNQFATMTGLLTVVGTTGNIVAATPLAACANAFGWRPAFVGAAVLSLVVGALAWTLVGDHPATSKTPLTLRQAAPQVFKNRQTWLGSALHFGWFGGYITLTGLWGVPYLMHVYGFTRIKAANFMVWMAIAYTVMAFAYGAISDRWRHRKPLLLAAGAVFLSLWIVMAAWPGGKPPIAVTGVIFLLTSAASSATILAFAVIKESNVPSASGLAMALGNSGILCVGILQPLLGYMLDRGWQGALTATGTRLYSADSYQRTFIAFVALGAGALLAAAFVRETHCRNLTEAAPSAP